MKKYFLIGFILPAIIAKGQIKQGTIFYERKVDVHRRMQDDQMKAMVPQFQITKSELIFDDNVSVYKALPEDNGPDPFDNGGNDHGLVIKTGGPDGNTILYKNYANQKFLEQREIGDKKYIVDDTIKSQSWKLSDETKTILNYLCKKATTKTEFGDDVVAWYAADINSPVGPDKFGGLPGAILQMDINKEEIVYRAYEFKTSAENNELNEPLKGKHITRDDFNKKLDEIYGPARPDGGRTIIKN